MVVLKGCVFGVKKFNCINCNNYFDSIFDEDENMIKYFVVKTNKGFICATCGNSLIDKGELVLVCESEL